MYGGTHVPLRVTDDSSGRHDSEMVQFLDLFSIPEATLFADVMEVRTLTAYVKVHVQVYNNNFPPHIRQVDLCMWLCCCLCSVCFFFSLFLFFISLRTCTLWCSVHAIFMHIQCTEGMQTILVS